MTRRYDVVCTAGGTGLGQYALPIITPASLSSFRMRMRHVSWQTLVWQRLAERCIAGAIHKRDDPDRSHACPTSPLTAKCAAEISWSTRPLFQTAIHDLRKIGVRSRNARALSLTSNSLLAAIMSVKLNGRPEREKRRERRQESQRSYERPYSTIR